MTTKTTLMTFLLDETGSMHAIEDETIKGFNGFLRELQASQANYKFTLVQWDSDHKTIVYDNVPVSRVAERDSRNYRPGGMTPLIDVICSAIKKMERSIPAGEEVQVHIVIQTDGQENCSSEFSAEMMRALVAEKQAQGWLFTFLGAGIDAIAVAQDYGFDTAHALHYDHGTSKAAFAATARVATHYATTGRSVGYTVDDRAATGGHLVPQDDVAKSSDDAAEYKQKPSADGGIEW